MHLKSTLFVALGLSISAAAVAQQPLTIEDAVLGLRGGKFMPENLVQLSWIPNTNTYTQIVKDQNNQYLIANDVKKKHTDTLLSLAHFNEKVLGKKDSLKNFPTYRFTNDNNIIVNVGRDVYEYNLLNKDFDRSSKKLFSFPKQAANIFYNKHNNLVAYTIDNNLYVQDAAGKTQQITQHTNPNIISGAAVHRNEFGIDRGIFFSPEGNLIAYYTMDQTMVADYPIVNWQKTPAVNTNIKYPMAGQTSHQVTLQVYNPKTGAHTSVKVDGPKDQYLTAVSWSQDEQHIYIGVLNRAQKHMKMNQYNAKTGAFIKTLFEEQHDKYVEPQQPLHFVSNTEFLWMSQRDGFMHLYLYNTNGKLIKQVTKGNWIVNGIVSTHKDINSVYISATKDSPLEKHTYAVNYRTGKMEKLDQAAGIHTPKVNTTGTYIIDHYQNATTPRNIVINNNKGKTVKTLLVAEDKLAQTQTANVQQVTLKADDGTPLYGKLITPKNLDVNKQYPVIVYLYNGPHLQLINNGYPASGNLWYDYMTDKGYIVFTMDGRGSSNRGFKFESATHGELGQVEMKDQLVGVDYLKSLPYVDANRLGVHGWSFGGFMTTSLMTQYPDVFKAGVAGGPVIEWDMYEIMYTERYMENPTTNKAGFEKTGLVDKVKNLKGRLLMIHGTDDDVVLWQHSLKFIEQSVKDGILVDYFAYPGHQHNVLGKDRVHLMKKVTDYFDTHLK